MSNLRQAAQQALEALESAGEAVYAHGGIAAVGSLNTAAQALRAALAEPEQPVEYVRDEDNPCYMFTAPTPQHDTDCHLQGICQRSGYSISPAPRKPLTNEELLAIYKDHIDDAGWGYERALIAEYEAKQKEASNGS